MDAAIDVHNLLVRFGDFTAVDAITFSVPHGKIFAFLGPNGAGKTTTIKVLTTLLHPTDGTVLINGHEVTHAQSEVRQSFGICFQDQSLDDDLTALENLEYHGILYSVPKEKRRQKIDELLALVELSDRKHDLVRTFSGGMKRRLELARALIHEPSILYLDEPTLGLDPQTRNHIWNYIKDLNTKTGMTIFFTTHYMDEAERFAQEVAIIDAGKIVARGTPAQLIASSGTTRLEDAFISLTGRVMRDESVGALDHLRQAGRMWGGNRR